MRSKKLASILNYSIIVLSLLTIAVMTFGAAGEEQELPAESFITLILTFLLFGASIWNALLFRRFINYFYFKLDLSKSMSRTLLITRIAHFVIGVFSFLSSITTIARFSVNANSSSMETAVSITITLFFWVIAFVFIYTALLQIKMIKKSKKYFWEVAAAF